MASAATCGRRVRRERRDDVGQARVSFGPLVGVLGGGEALHAGELVQAEHVVGRHQARLERDRRRAQQRIAGFDRHQLLEAAPFDLEIGAGMAHHPGRAQVQEGRTARAPAMLDRALRPGRSPPPGRARRRRSNPGPLRWRKLLATQPSGVFTEMPMPLSSQTYSTGAGSCWYAVHAAALNAVCAVAWLLDASPKEQIAIESAGIGSVCPMRRACSMATAVPSALGRCEAMVEVCGSTHSGLLPQTLCRPPEIGSSLLAAKLSAESMIGSMPGNLRKRSAMKPPRTVMQERRIGMPRQARDHRVALVARGTDRVEDLLLHAQHPRHQVEVARDQLRFEQLEEVASGAARCPAAPARPARLARRAAVPAAHELDEVLVADLGAVDVLLPGGNELGYGGHGMWIPQCVNRAFNSGAQRNPACASTRASQARIAG